MHIRILFTLFSAFLPGLLPAEAYTHQVTREWPAGTYKKINLAVDAADVVVSGWELDRIRVVLDMSVDTPSQEKAQAAFDKWVLDLEEGEILEMRLKKQQSKWGWLAFWKPSANVSVQLFLPDNEILNVATGAGDVLLEKVNSTVVVATGAGDVQTNSFTGSINVATGAGDVDLNGTITHFQIATGAGDARVVSTTGPEKNSAIATGKGDIALVLPRNANFLLKASVGFGDISCQFPLIDLREEKHSLVGYTAPDAPRISLDAGFGDVRVTSQDWQEN